MKGLRELISGFIDRQGGYLMIAAMLSKLASYATSLYVLNVLTKEQFGTISFVYTTLSFIIPFMGMGIAQSMLRFGAQSSQTTTSMLGPAMRTGSLICLVFIGLSYGGFTLVGPDLEGLQGYALILSFMILTLFWSELLRSYSRARMENRTVAYADIIQAGTLLLIALLSGVNPDAYPMALVLATLVSAGYILLRSSISIKDLMRKGRVPKEWYSYGIFISLSAVLAQLMFAVDVINIGYILQQEERLATYKASTILPIGFLIIPATFIGTDLALLVKNSLNQSFIWNYFKRFFILFLSMGLVVAAMFFFWGEDIARLIAPSYDSEELGRLMFIISLGGVGAMSLRIPTGNLLTAVGWARTNAFLALITLFLNVGLNYWLVNSMGIEGAAWASMSLLWVSGILGFVGLRLYLRRIKGQSPTPKDSRTAFATERGSH